MVLQVLAVPVMPFIKWILYYPSWQEVATTLLPVAYGIILVAFSYRYLPVFPQEAELNPIDPPVGEVAPSELETASTPDAPEGDLQPAQA
jgi:molybdopterin-containing oxidoreductase family membrane subunit